jgi:hypothetical protein
LPFTTNSTVLGVVLRPGIVKSVLQVKSGILGGVKLYFRACLFSYTKSFTLSWWLRVGDWDVLPVEGLSTHPGAGHSMEGQRDDRSSWFTYPGLESLIYELQMSQGNKTD